VLELETTLPDGRPGQPEKWVQFIVCCATNAPLTDCEAWLTKVERLDGENPENLVPEQVRCDWSQLSDKKLTIPPLREQRVNLFVLSGGRVNPKVEHIKIRLDQEMQRPGKYLVQVLVTAQNAPSLPASFVFEWRNFGDVSLGAA
jgi:hypothetical protein